MLREPMRRFRFALTLLLGLATAANAGPRGGPGWHDAKCARYKRAWAAALARQGEAGLSAAFLAAHQAFLNSNCMRRADVCAKSPAELRLADTMVVLSMNFGAASTFAPFYCR
jgi:hypothetical protein